MKKALALMLALAMVFALCACGKTEAPAAAPAAAPEAAPAEAAPAEAAPAEAAPAEAEYEETVLKFGTTSSDTSLTGMAFYEFSDRLKEKSNGKVDFQVYTSSVLGNNDEMVQGVQMGTIDMTIVTPSGVADMGAKSLTLLSLPYLFKDYQQYFNTVFGEVGDKLLQEVTDNIQGIYGFSFLPDSGRNFFNNIKPITCIEDIQGMKLRVMPYAIDSAMAEAIGFSATPISWSEVYQSVQSGVVDGAENPLSGYDGNSLYEVAPYLTLDCHYYSCPVLMMSEITWNKLPDNVKSLLKETWLEVINEWYVPNMESYEAGLLEKFEGLGVTVSEITDYEKWAEAVTPVWDEYGADIQDLITAARAN